MNFEWDPDKDRSKHSVSFSEAVTIFGDPLELTIADPDHSAGEYRYLSIGLSANHQVLVVAYTERGDRIRIISARPATKKERSQYESSF